MLAKIIELFFLCNFGIVKADQYGWLDITQDARLS